MDDRWGTKGPVQVLLIGIDRSGSEEMIAAELQDLGTQTAIRAVDLLRVRRSLDGEVRRLAPTDPGGHSGRLIEALLYEADAPTSERRANPLAAEPEETRWSLAERIPRGSAVAILLIEHRWAIPLREAAGQLGAEIFGDAWIHPRDLELAIRQARSVS
ncbi:MAG: hypothetical protein JSU06_04675 [Actinobacteria bacterium]|nr:hypothetical protein [Actinomycetota bacterium]